LAAFEEDEVPMSDRIPGIRERFDKELAPHLAD
jgi:hypothetical protein